MMTQPLLFFFLLPNHLFTSFLGVHSQCLGTERENRAMNLAPQFIPIQLPQFASWFFHYFPKSVTTVFVVCVARAGPARARSAIVWGSPHHHQK
jgi:hypothetical protein